jgi:hypothetical protein
VEAFDALIGLVQVFSGGMSSIQRRRRSLEEAEKPQIRS